MTIGVRTFFEPKGIIIAGARSTPGFGFGIPASMKAQGWGDRLFLVSPRGGELEGLPVYKSIKDVPGPADLAVVIVPARIVPQTLEELADYGIRHVIIESAGFAETGMEGKALQAQIREIALDRGLRVIGPNCVGVINTANRFATAEVLEEVYTPGGLAIIAQSGVFGNVLLDRVNPMGLFISKAVTLGNRLDVNESEMLDFFYDDPDTKQILMYLEGAADGRLLMDTLKKVSRKKPVLVLKSGRTSVGKAATASHTGSLSGEDELYRDMFAQTGAIRAETLEELVQFNRMFNALALPKGNRLGVVTSSGSMGALTADAAIAAGLVLPGLSDETKAKVKQGAPSWMNVCNPLDVGPSGQYSQAFNALMDDPDIDMVLAIIAVPYSVLKQFLEMGMPADRFFGDFSGITEKARTKPVAMCVVGHSEFVQHMRNVTEPEIPVLESPETAAKGMAALWQYSKWRAAH